MFTKFKNEKTQKEEIKTKLNLIKEGLNADDKQDTNFMIFLDKYMLEQTSRARNIKIFDPLHEDEDMERYKLFDHLISNCTPITDASDAFKMGVSL